MCGDGQCFNDNPRMFRFDAKHTLLALLTTLVWAAAMGLTVAVGLQLWQMRAGQATAVSPLAMGSGPRDVPLAQVKKVLVGRTVQPDQAAAPDQSDVSRLSLQGVVHMGRGLGGALIAVDGQAPKPYRVGQVVAEQWRLESVSPRQASLRRVTAGSTDAAPALVVEMPAVESHSNRVTVPGGVPGRAIPSGPSAAKPLGGSPTAVPGMGSSAAAVSTQANSDENASPGREPSGPMSMP